MSDLRLSHNVRQDICSRAQMEALTCYYGAMPQIRVGDTWMQRRELTEALVHKSRAVIDIGDEGPYSIVLTGTKNINDQGYTFSFSTGEIEKSSRDIRPMRPFNRCLEQAVVSRHPIRIIRGSYLRSPYAPNGGYRYDGLYICKTYVPQRLNDDKWILKFLFARCLDEPPAKWLYDKSDSRPIVVNASFIRIQQKPSEEERLALELSSREQKERFRRIKQEAFSKNDVVEIIAEEPPPIKEICLSDAFNFDVVIEDCITLEGTEFGEEEEIENGGIEVVYNTKKEESVEMITDENLNHEEEAQNSEIENVSRLMVESGSSEEEVQPESVYLITDTESMSIVKDSPQSSELQILEEPLKIDDDMIDPLATLVLKSPLSHIPLPESDNDRDLLNLVPFPLTDCLQVSSTPLNPLSLRSEGHEPSYSETSDDLHSKENERFYMENWCKSIVPCKCSVPQKFLYSIIGKHKTDLFNLFHNKYFCSCGASVNRKHTYDVSFPKAHELLTEMWNSNSGYMTEIIMFLVSSMARELDVPFVNEPRKNEMDIFNKASGPTSTGIFNHNSPRIEVQMADMSGIMDKTDVKVCMVLKNIYTCKVYNLLESQKDPNMFVLEERNVEPALLENMGLELPISLDLSSEMKLKAPKSLNKAPRKRPPEETTDRVVVRKRGRPKGSKNKATLAVVNERNMETTHLTEKPIVVTDSEQSNYHDLPHIESIDSLHDDDVFLGACDGLIDSCSSETVRKIYIKPIEQLVPKKRKRTMLVKDFFNKSHFLGHTQKQVNRAQTACRNFTFYNPYDGKFLGFSKEDIKSSKSVYVSFRNYYKSRKLNNT